MTGFELFLVSPKNPRRMFDSPVDPGRFNIRGVAVVVANPELNGLWLQQWASLEALSETSCPTDHRLRLPEWWVGSGRWQSADGGGWLLWLRDRVNAWSDLPGRDRADWERLAVQGVVNRRDVNDWFLLFAPVRLTHAAPVWFFPSLGKMRTWCGWVLNSETVGSFADELFRFMTPEGFKLAVEYPLSKFGFRVVDGEQGFVFEEIPR